MKPLGDDEFMVSYGAADTDVGVATIKVTAAASLPQANTAVGKEGGEGGQAPLAAHADE